MNLFTLIPWLHSKDRANGSQSNVILKKSFQGPILHRLALDWAVWCFGIVHMLNVPVRALRAAEEMTEFAQCTNLLTPSMRGRQVQWIPSLGKSLCRSICSARRTIRTLMHYLKPSFAACWRSPHESFSVRNQEKNNMGLNIDTQQVAIGRREE